MYKHILIATDGSEFSVRALNSGLRLAGDLRRLSRSLWSQRIGRRLRLPLRCDFASRTQSSTNDSAAAAQSVLADATEAARQTGMSINQVYVARRPPAEGIVETAQRLDCDLIAMGSHGRRGLTTLIIGSVTNEVLATSRLPVLIIR
jgi:nucleotide-binding universal stress UspA family protein